MPVRASRRLRLAISAALLVAMAGGLGGSSVLATTDPNVISREGSTLMLHRDEYRFTGVNAYELGTYWSVNTGCGQQLTNEQLDALFRSLRPDSVVRFWAFQSLGVNKTTKRLDFTGIDRVFRAAERHGQRLIPVLGNQSGVCDDGRWKDLAWYAGGYASRFDDDTGVHVMPYASWVTAVVTRYRASPALGMWEPVNEPEATDCLAGYAGSDCYTHHPPCPAAGAMTLRRFFDRVGAQIKRLDAKHLVASGVIGANQCGLQGTNYAIVHGSSGIDVATYHDYGQDTAALPGDRKNGFLARAAQADALDKPLISEEVGIQASWDGANGCVEPSQRAVLLAAKLRAQLAAGSRGFLPWFYAPFASGGCRHELTPTDPALLILRRTSP